MRKWEEQFDEVARAKGKRLQRERKVEDLVQGEAEITAEIAGMKRYKVSIARKNGELTRMKCQCPKARGGSKCEHMAAVLYAVYGIEEDEKRKEAEESALRKKRERLIEEARKRAEEEEVRKAQEEERRKAREKEQEEERKRAREEAAARIAERDARKAAKKAERRQKRKEAEEAFRQAAEAEARKREQEALALKEEEERKAREEEARRQQEALERERKEAERRAKKEQKVQEAIRRAEKVQEEMANGHHEETMQQEKREKRQERQPGRQQEKRQEEQGKQQGRQQTRGQITEYPVDDYSYFDMNLLRHALKITSEDRKKGRQLANSGKIRIISVETGYLEDDTELVAEVRAEGTHRNMEFEMYLLFTRTRVVSRRCGCPECRKRPYWYWDYESCSYMAGLLEMLEPALKESGVGDATDRVASQVLRAFRGRHEISVMAEKNKKEQNLQLIPRLGRNGAKLELSFRIGEEKLFVVKNLFELCEHVEKSETAVYGSKTEISHQLSNFTEEGRKWYAYIHGIIAEERQLEQRIDEEGGFYNARKTGLGKIRLYGKRLDEFYELLGDGEIEYDEQKKRQMLKEREKNPRITMTIRKADFGGRVFHGVDISCRMPVVYRGTETAYFVEQGGFCRADKAYMDKAQFLMQRAQDGKLEFQIGRNNLAEFYYMMLPELEEVADVIEEDPEEIHAYLPPEVEFIFYLDAEKQDLTCRAHARYGEREVTILDVLDKEIKASAERYRVMNKEAEMFYRVTRLFPQVDIPQDLFHCGEDEAQMYEILEHGVEELMDLGEVQYTQKFRDLFRIRRAKVSLGVSVSAESILNLDIVTEDMSQEDLLNVLKNYKARKKYYRMKNGDFMSLEDDSLEVLEEMMHALNVSPKEIAKGHIECPAYRTLYLDKLLEAHEELYQTRDSHFRELVKSFKTISDADFEVPGSLEGVMRGYQKNGYRWIRTLESCHFGGILADDMGLGKTLQAISVLLAGKEEGREGTSLIVCPASLVFNWGEELARFAPQLATLLVTGGQSERRALLEEYRSYDVMITSYDLLKRDIACYENKWFLYQIIDEAQYIKNHTTAVAKAVKVVRSEYKLAMTGTPIENRLSELWSIFDFLMPGFLYTYEVFRRELELPIVKNNDENAMARLKKMVGVFILRRTKGEVLKDLPEKLEETRYVKMDTEQQRLYDAQVVHMKTQIAGQGDAEFNKNKLQIYAELMRLRQICCDPSLCFENYKGESAKLESCMELVQSAIDGGHKILLFSQFTSMLDILEARLDALGIAHYVITGSTAKEKRLQLVKAFNQDQTPVFLISLKAGGVGLNLTGADVVIHYDPWWNLAVQNQATDRAHRIGQKKKVVVYKVIVKQSIEEKIQKLQETKKDLADQIVNAESGQLGSMSREELLELLDV